MKLWPRADENDGQLTKTWKAIVRDAWIAVPVIAVILLGRGLGWF